MIRFILGAGILVRYGVILVCQTGLIVDRDVVKIGRLAFLGSLSWLLYKV
jgi:hypothetical protein